jgi:hypothetical protein
MTLDQMTLATQLQVPTGKNEGKAEALVMTNQHIQMMQTRKT